MATAIAHYADRIEVVEQDGGRVSLSFGHPMSAHAPALDERGNRTLAAETARARAKAAAIKRGLPGEDALVEDKGSFALFFGTEAMSGEYRHGEVPGSESFLGDLLSGLDWLAEREGLEALDLNGRAVWSAQSVLDG